MQIHDTRKFTESIYSHTNPLTNIEKGRWGHGEIYVQSITFYIFMCVSRGNQGHYHRLVLLRRTQLQ